ncbi:hypothetical protein LLH06_12800 [Mucilaginibacter daejeonensis]|uniref:hypothetical protein n=1 Tax=Mucilaginibacter daejeonensis TaxID=398049 RepID=UPI001D17A143|nr:hypothetical protein [Mucilaginibacter daejeonensis]UEG51842.1 hypothetical protein LLH06_12800 [Mucilaginibacter daejeonensis]
MTDRFIQKPVILDDDLSNGRLKVSLLMTLLADHPYKDQVAETFKIAEIEEEYILVDHIDTLFKKISNINKNFHRFAVNAQSKHINIRQSEEPVKNLSNPLPLVFNFEEYAEVDEVKTDLDCYAIYDSKNTYFDTYDMAKYANRLYKDGLGELAQHNLDYFKALAGGHKKYNRYRSYRMVVSDGQVFLRGITSVDRYYEYGVDFAFVVSMLALHRDMKKHEGNRYAITSAAASESKLEIIVADKDLKDAGPFGKASSAIIITTNDLGQGSLNYQKIIRVGGRLHGGVYLFNSKEEANKSELIISHRTGPKKTLESLSELDMLLNDTQDFINDLLSIKTIKTPDELRARIEYKLTNPRSAFREIRELRDIFKTKISNEIKAFAKLLEMCDKAEQLEIDYDLKDKLRYIISEIILNKKS